MLIMEKLITTLKNLLASMKTVGCKFQEMKYFPHMSVNITLLLDKQLEAVDTNRSRICDADFILTDYKFKRGSLMELMKFAISDFVKFRFCIFY